ncbi:MAG TPA: hypothetical protein VF941_16570 [Clostridia bacterium]
MEEELQFLVATDADIDTVFDILHSTFNFDYKHHKRKYEFLIDKNNIEIAYNEDYSPSLVDSDDGFLYYQCLITVYPVSDDAALSEQIELAKKMRSLLIKRGIKAEVAASFENLL